jgi:DHA2 family multidrug resistance protein
LAISAGGLTILLLMPLVGFLVGKVDARYLVMFGFTAVAIALYHSTGIDLQMGFWDASKIRVYQSLGVAFLFVPLNTLSYVGTSPRNSNDVSGLINLARNIGGSCGTSLFTTVLARHQQVHQAYLAEHAYAANPAYLDRIAVLTQQALAHVPSMADAQRQALAQLYHQVQSQASILSYIDVIGLLMVLSALAIPLPLLLKKAPRGAAVQAH